MSFQSATSQSSSSYTSNIRNSTYSSSSVDAHDAQLSLTSLSQPLHETQATHLTPDTHPTLLPISQALTLVRSAIHTHKHSHIQPAIACTISALRALLAATGCLQRESPTLADFPVLARLRKGLMSDLAKLVALARTTAHSVQEAEYQASLGAGEGYGAGPSEYELEGILDASEVSGGDVQRFVGALVECGIALPLPKEGSGSLGGMSASEGRGQSLEERMDAGKSPRNEGRRERKLSGRGGLRLDTSRHTEQGFLGAPLSGVSDSTGGWKYPVHQSPEMARTMSTGSTLSEHYHELGRSHRGSISSASSATSSGRSAGSLSASAILTTPSTSLAVQPNGRIHVSAAVHAAQDAFSSTMAALIGHVQAHTVASHPSSHAHLIELTREAIDRVRDLLGVMEGIARQSPTQDGRTEDQVAAMERERNVLYETTGQLVEAAEMVASTPYRDAPTTTDERDKQALLDRISVALKVARECCRLCKVCAMATGDWTPDFKSGLGQSSAVETTYAPDRGHGRTSSTSSADGRRTKFGWETTDDEDEEELIHTLDEEDYTLHPGQMSRRKVGLSV
jgi:son of sevenless-like protein